MTVILFAIAMALTYYLISKKSPGFQGLLGFISFLCLLPIIVCAIGWFGSPLLFNGANASSGTGFGIFLVFIMTPLSVIFAALGAWLYDVAKKRNSDGPIIDIK
jgi:hypothetical protein